MRKTLVTALLGVMLLNNVNATEFPSHLNRHENQPNIKLLLQEKSQKNIFSSSSPLLKYTLSAKAFYDANLNAEWTLSYIFEHPQNGKLKMLPSDQDVWDDHSRLHFQGSVLLGAGLNSYFDQTHEPNPILKSALISIGMGIAKEFMDASREGFSKKDFYLDVAGTATGILVYQTGKYIINKIKGN